MICVAKLSGISGLAKSLPELVFIFICWAIVNLNYTEAASLSALRTGFRHHRTLFCAMSMSFLNSAGPVPGIAAYRSRIESGCLYSICNVHGHDACQDNLEFSLVQIARDTSL